MDDGRENRLGQRGNSSKHQFQSTGRTRSHCTLYGAVALLCLVSLISADCAKAQDGSDADPVEATLREADRLLGRTREEGSSAPRDQNSDSQSLIDSAGRLETASSRSQSLSRLASMFGRQKEFSSAREAALEIDQAQIAERTKALIAVARAEEAADETEDAWLTLREALNLALKLKQPEQMIALMAKSGLSNAT